MSSGAAFGVILFVYAAVLLAFFASCLRKIRLTAISLWLGAGVLVALCVIQGAVQDAPIRFAFIAAFFVAASALLVWVFSPNGKQFR